MSKLNKIQTEKFLYFYEMLKWFKGGKTKDPGKSVLIEDLNGNSLASGDTVESLRYDLGICDIDIIDGELFYISRKDGQKVSYVKMIDAASKRQKVIKKIKWRQGLN